VEDLPQSLVPLLLRATLEPRFPAYLAVRRDGSLLQWGGALLHYGIESLSTHTPIEQQVEVLHGLFPFPDQTTFSLPCIEIHPGVFVDILCLPALDIVWIVLLDVTQAARERQAWQQQLHERVVQGQRSGAMNQLFTRTPAPTTENT
jgi:hypothetical protein